VKLVVPGGMGANASRDSHSPSQELQHPKFLP